MVSDLSYIIRSPYSITDDLNLIISRHKKEMQAERKKISLTLAKINYISQLNFSIETTLA